MDETIYLAAHNPMMAHNVVLMVSLFALFVVHLIAELCIAYSYPPGELPDSTMVSIIRRALISLVITIVGIILLAQQNPHW